MTGNSNVSNLSPQFYFEIVMESHVIGVCRWAFINNARIGKLLLHQLNWEKIVKFRINFSY